jgi:hypothetical protein
MYKKCGIQKDVRLVCPLWSTLFCLKLCFEKFYTLKILLNGTCFVLRRYFNFTCKNVVFTCSDNIFYRYLNTHSVMMIGEPVH